MNVRFPGEDACEWMLPGKMQISERISDNITDEWVVFEESKTNDNIYESNERMNDFLKKQMTEWIHRRKANEISIKEENRRRNHKNWKQVDERVTFERNQRRMNGFKKNGRWPNGFKKKHQTKHSV